VHLSLTAREPNSNSWGEKGGGGSVQKQAVDVGKRKKLQAPAPERRLASAGEKPDPLTGQFIDGENAVKRRRRRSREGGRTQASALYSGKGEPRRSKDEFAGEAVGVVDCAQKEGKGPTARWDKGLCRA